jgi:hypothetical protein
LRSKDGSSSTRRRDVEIVSQDLGSNSTESLTLQRLVGILIVIVVFLLRLVVERGAVAEQEAKGHVEGRETTLSPRRHELSYALQDEGAALEGDVGVALELDGGRGRVRVVLGEGEGGAKEEGTVERNRACSTCDMDL